MDPPMMSNSASLRTNRLKSIERKEKERSEPGLWLLGAFEDGKKGDGGRRPIANHAACTLCLLVRPYV